MRALLEKRAWLGTRSTSRHTDYGVSSPYVNARSAPDSADALEVPYRTRASLRANVRSQEGGSSVPKARPVGRLEFRRCARAAPDPGGVGQR